jgi:hypothetical protein
LGLQATEKWIEWRCRLIIQYQIVIRPEYFSWKSYMYLFVKWALRLIELV